MEKLADPERAKSSRWFFKTGPGQYGEGDRFLGITVPVLRGLTREFESLTLPAIEALLQSGWHEERLLALLVLVRQYARGDSRAQDAIYRCYIGNRDRINNWDLVDCSAPQIVGAHLQARGRRFLRELARSKSLWDRRIAILATFHYIKRREFADALAIARMLFGDREDLIHKAVGWMLREIGKRDQPVLEAFLQQHAGRMPRTSLRYAIERFPGPLRRRYLTSVDPALRRSTSP
jgi:3-methyladenine DNA glycosylase AlkD